MYNGFTGNDDDKDSLSVHGGTGGVEMERVGAIRSGRSSPTQLPPTLSYHRHAYSSSQNPNWNDSSRPLHGASSPIPPYIDPNPIVLYTPSALSAKPMRGIKKGIRRTASDTRRWASAHPFIMFLLVCGSLMATAMTGYSTYNWAWGRMYGDISKFVPPDADGIVLLASISRLDLEDLEASITWLPFGCGPRFAIQDDYSHFPLQKFGPGCGRPREPMRIIINSGKPFDFDPNSADYRYVPDTQHGSGAPNSAGVRTWVPDFDTFNTTENVNPQFAVSRSWSSSSYYPWDVYHIIARIWITAPPDNVTTADDDALGLPLPVVKIFALDSPTGLPVESGSWTVRTTDGRHEATEVHFLIYRHPIVKAFAMTIFFINWGLTLIMVWILVLAATDRYMSIPKEILLLPITAILTIPQLRATMPGVPSSFGLLIDIPGYFFTMTIIIICAILIVLLMMHRKPRRISQRRNSGKDFSDEEDIVP